MYRKVRKIISLLLLAVFVMPHSAFAVDSDIQPYASISFKIKDASLIESNGTLAIDYYVQANTSVSKIGVSSITLHDATAGTAKNYSGITTSVKMTNGLKVLGSGVSGHRYYATVVLCAFNSNGSGATYTVTTNYVTV